MKRLKKSRYEETDIKFDILGQPKRSSNPNYIPSDVEYNALREVYLKYLKRKEEKNGHS